MLKAAGNAITMEKAVKKLLFENRIQSSSCEKASRPCIRISFFQLSSLAVIEKSSSQIASKHRDSMKVRTIFLFFLVSYAVFFLFLFLFFVLVICKPAYPRT
ncbi:hypothetical protein CsSME_00005266 [Camellia sinensis var. sinensis]